MVFHQGAHRTERARRENEGWKDEKRENEEEREMEKRKASEVVR